MDVNTILDSASELTNIRITRTPGFLYRTILPSLSLIGAGVLVVLGVRKKLPLQKAAIGAGTCAAAAVASRVLACRFEKLNVKPILETIKKQELEVLNFSQIDIETLLTNKSKDSYAKELFIEIVKNLPTDSTLKKLENWPAFELSTEDVPTEMEDSQTLGLLLTALTLLPEDATITINVPFSLDASENSVVKALKTTQGRVKFDELELVNPTQQMFINLEEKIEVNVLKLKDTREEIESPIFPTLILKLDPQEIWISEWKDKKNIIDFCEFRDSYDIDYKINSNPSWSKLSESELGEEERKEIYRSHCEETIKLLRAGDFSGIEHLACNHLCYTKYPTCFWKGHFKKKMN